MAENLGVQFFTDAKAQYEFAAKWRWAVLVLLAYLHVGLVAPFATYTSEMAKLDPQLDDSRAMAKALRPVLDQADKLGKRIKDAQDQVAEHLKSELVERFKRLNTAVTALTALNPSEAEGPKGEGVFKNPTTPTFQQQPARPDPFALAPMKPELRRQVAAIAKAVGDGELPTELQDYINSEVIGPAFVRANSEWASSGRDLAQNATSLLADDISPARVKAPTPKELGRFDDSVKALLDAAQHLKFEPPPNSDWWRTAAGKGTTILMMMSGFAASVQNFNTSETALQQLAAHIDDLNKKNQDLEKKLNSTLAELEKQANELQSQLGEIGALLKVISFKLSEIAPLMPLVVAGILAAIAVWTADGLRRMTLAAGLVSDEADGVAIRTWLHAAAGGSRARIAGVEIAVAAAAIVWVLTAAYTVAALWFSFLTLSILVVIAVALVAAARAYRWRCADEAASDFSRSANQLVGADHGQHDATTRPG
jgi:hypothetical protein